MRPATNQRTSNVQYRTLKIEGNIVQRDFVSGSVSGVVCSAFEVGCSMFNPQPNAKKSLVVHHLHRLSIQLSGCGSLPWFQWRRAASSSEFSRVALPNSMGPGPERQCRLSPGLSKVPWRWPIDHAHFGIGCRVGRNAQIANQSKAGSIRNACL